jgi:hypothetical protein
MYSFSLALKDDLRKLERTCYSSESVKSGRKNAETNRRDFGHCSEPSQSFVAVLKSK